MSTEKSQPVSGNFAGNFQPSTKSSFDKLWVHYVSNRSKLQSLTDYWKNVDWGAIQFRCDNSINFSRGDILAVNFDIDKNTFELYKNGVNLGETFKVPFNDSLNLTSFSTLADKYLRRPVGVSIAPSSLPSYSLSRSAVNEPMTKN